MRPTSPPARHARLRPPRRHLAAAAFLLLPVACDDNVVSSGSGAVRASFSTTGTDVDADGYTVAVDNGTGSPVGTNGSYTFAGLSVGRHTLVIGGVRQNCALDGDAMRQFTVVADQTVDVTPKVACVFYPGALGHSAADAVGDTLPNDSFGPDRAIDIVAANVRYKGDSVIFTLRFGGPVRPASAALPNSVYGRIDLDVDEDPGTGAPPYMNFFGADAPLGAEYAIDLFVATDSTARLLSVFRAPAEVRAVFAGDSVQVRLTRALLEGDEGNLAYGAIVGLADRPSDFAPNTGVFAARNPELPTAAATLAGARAAAPRVAPERRVASGVSAPRWGAPGW